MLAAEGAAVFAVDLNSERLDELVARIAGAGGLAGDRCCYRRCWSGGSRDRWSGVDCVGAIAMQMKRIEGGIGPYTTTQIAAGSLTALIFVVACAFWTGAAFRPDGNAEIAVVTKSFILRTALLADLFVAQIQKYSCISTIFAPRPLPKSLALRN